MVAQFFIATPESKDLEAATQLYYLWYYSNELLLSKKTTASFNYQFNNCLLKTRRLRHESAISFATDAIHTRI
jgi:hypothetical protein